LCRLPDGTALLNAMKGQHQQGSLTVCTRLAMRRPAAHLGLGLQQRQQDGRAADVAEVGERAHNLQRGAGVQAGGNAVLRGKL